MLETLGYEVKWPLHVFEMEIHHEIETTMI